MREQHATTRCSRPLECVLVGEPPKPRSRRRLGVCQTARVLVRLARGRNRLRHVPTLGQVRAMAWLDGREPCSYLLDPEHNFVPSPLEFGSERELGREVLSFSCRDERGWQMEMVVMADGGGFDLVGVAGRA